MLWWQAADLIGKIKIAGRQGVVDSSPAAGVAPGNGRDLDGAGGGGGWRVGDDGNCYY